MLIQTERGETLKQWIDFGQPGWHPAGVTSLTWHQLGTATEQVAEIWAESSGTEVKVQDTHMDMSPDFV